MSHFDYQTSKEIAAQDYPFYALIIKAGDLELLRRYREISQQQRRLGYVLSMAVLQDGRSAGETLDGELLTAISYFTKDASAEVMFDLPAKEMVKLAQDVLGLPPKSDTSSMPRPESAEEHLGNALTIIRLWKQAKRGPTLEEFGAVVVRVQRAQRELERGNV